MTVQTLSPVPPRYMKRVDFNICFALLSEKVSSSLSHPRTGTGYDALYNDEEVTTKDVNFSTKKMGWIILNSIG